VTESSTVSRAPQRSSIGQVIHTPATCLCRQVVSLATDPTAVTLAGKVIMGLAETKPAHTTPETSRPGKGSLTGVKVPVW